MKVLQVINVLIRGGGAEKLVLDLLLAFKKQAIDVEVLSIWNPYTVNKGEFCDILKQHEIPIHFLSGSNLYSPINLYRYYKIIKENKYDVIHTHIFPAFYYSGFLNLVARPNAKFIYTEHNTDNRRRYFTVFKLLDKLIYNQYDKVVCITKAVEVALKKHVSIAHTSIISNGINVSSFSNALPLSKTELLPKYVDGDKLILMNARFVDSKDHLTLLKAMKLLPDNVYLLLLGAGGFEEKYKRFCVEENISERVVFLGIRSDVNRLLKTVDINVLSSNHEGFSLSMLESMASGKPFVASDVPGIKDLVTGYAELFPHKNEKALAEVIKELLSDQSYAIEVADKCLNFANNFDINKCADMYVELYKSELKL